MKLTIKMIEDLIGQEVNAMFDEWKRENDTQTEANPYHGKVGARNAGKFTKATDTGSWSLDGQQHKYSGGKRGRSTAPCGRKDSSRKRTCSMGVISEDEITEDDLLRTMTARELKDYLRGMIKTSIAQAFETDECEFKNIKRKMPLPIPPKASKRKSK